MSKINFKDKVVIVTGSGGGLGRIYALDFAKRGAKLVINDLGVSTSGEGQSSKAADKVVEEIKALGGQAVANYDSVTDGDKVVKTAIDAFGRIDIIVNNAGILRDRSFIKMTDKDWSLVYMVHVKGTYSVVKAAWPYMQKQKYGRILNVTSAAGLYGNYGQAQYAAAKMAIVGFTKSLAIEGQKKNIISNVIAPIAGSRMTETILPPKLVKALKAEYVSPLVLYLTSDNVKENGQIYEIGAGWIAKVRWEASRGSHFPIDKDLSPEEIKENWSEISDFTNPLYPKTTRDSFGQVMANLQNKGKKKTKKTHKKSNVDVEKVLANKFPVSKLKYSTDDAILYALAIGAGADPTDKTELPFIYEGDDDFQVIPSFGVVLPSRVLGHMFGIKGIKFNPSKLLHGEQFMEIKNPIPTSGSVTNHAKVSGIYDKGKGALLVLDVTTKDEEGKDLVFNQFSLFIRGSGNFGGDKGPKPVNNSPPDRQPDIIQLDQTKENQAALYRLTGDKNPLHIDPNFSNFKKPILHGLCSFGYATRAVIKNFCNNDTTQFKNIRVRFSQPVYPGETIVTEMWKVSPSKVIFRCKVAERGVYVLKNCAVELKPSSVVKSNI